MLFSEPYLVNNSGCGESHDSDTSYQILTPANFSIMRKLLTLSTLIFFFSNVFGQIFDPVKWSFSSKQVSDNEFNLMYTANIESGWYIYSQYLESDDGPVKTSFTYDKGGHFSLAGKNIITFNVANVINVVAVCQQHSCTLYLI